MRRDFLASLRVNWKVRLWLLYVFRVLACVHLRLQVACAECVRVYACAHVILHWRFVLLIGVGLFPAGSEICEWRLHTLSYLFEKTNNPHTFIPLMTCNQTAEAMLANTQLHRIMFPRDSDAPSLHCIFFYTTVLFCCLSMTKGHLHPRESVSLSSVTDALNLSLSHFPHVLICVVLYAALLSLNKSHIVVCLLHFSPPGSFGSNRCSYGANRTRDPSLRQVRFYPVSLLLSSDTLSDLLCFAMYSDRLLYPHGIASRSCSCFLPLLSAREGEGYPCTSLVLVF